ncbi:IclR family transcriptional regulator [Pseudovibrio sp. SPO723]|uniref:IclR family transcriptional regulator n=1 Tax=Nesiotobacter zosterae TaxID=392721 RepID=UPI0029C58DFE|nr:IclR family transcriptional regulator [Pseudovibrio sp. SPO723]MDX5593598.1 IclR family transcriptional regulator [Pseudovibrio sp. SPO723]
MEQKKTNQSIDRAVSILSFIAENGNSARLMDMCDALDLKKSTLHGILATMQIHGLITQDTDTSRYSLGIKLFELGKIYEENFSLRQVIRPTLERLSAEFKESVHVGILTEDSVLYMDRIDSPYSIRVAAKAGHKAPLYCTAMGKGILAYSSEQRQEDYLAKGPFPRLTENTLCTADELRAELRAIRQRQWSIDNEEVEMGLICIASPVVNGDSKVIAAIGISGPKHRTDEATLDSWKAAIPAAARDLSQTMRFTR